MCYRRKTGFSLIELMVALAIVGIMAAVAYPAYTDSIRKSRRAEAKAALTELAQFMAKTFAENKTYQPGGANPTLSPGVQADEYYDFSLTATANTYTLTAAATAGTTQNHDRCGDLTLNHLGVKNIANADAGVTAGDCW